MALLRRSERDGRWQGRRTQQTALEGCVWLLKMRVATCIFIIICAGYLCKAPSCVYPLTRLSVRAGHCGWIDCPLSACRSRHTGTWWKPLKVREKSMSKWHLTITSMSNRLHVKRWDAATLKLKYFDSNITLNSIALWYLNTFSNCLTTDYGKIFNFTTGLHHDSCFNLFILSSSIHFYNL